MNNQSKDYKRNKSFTIRDSVVEKLEEMSYKTGETKSGIISRLIEQEYERLCKEWEK